ncbi:hypothetical protein [Bradyrhizobium sp. ARR65]|uniref:hypothetical protein n=1 Tax=Bradyrhizobium sp. ARR65 TaxID=1040989 RepID=UPI0004634F6D|nr:hypothetical protein [Bradyrhizobium sp. ARR65]
MKHLLGALLAAAAVIFAIEAFAQSATTMPPPTAVQANTAPAAPVTASKRFACRAAAQSFKGQDRADQMQLCMAQARLDCLKQAIDQKVVGPQRKEFIQTCVGE